MRRGSDRKFTAPAQPLAKYGTAGTDLLEKLRNSSEDDLDVDEIKITLDRTRHPNRLSAVRGTETDDADVFSFERALQSVATEAKLNVVQPAVSEVGLSAVDDACTDLIPAEAAATELSETRSEGSDASFGAFVKHFSQTSLKDDASLKATETEPNPELETSTVIVNNGKLPVLEPIVVIPISESVVSMSFEVEAEASDVVVLQNKKIQEYLHAPNQFGPAAKKIHLKFIPMKDRMASTNLNGHAGHARDLALDYDGDTRSHAFTTIKRSEKVISSEPSKCNVFDVDVDFDVYNKAEESQELNGDQPGFTYEFNALARKSPPGPTVPMLPLSLSSAGDHGKKSTLSVQVPNPASAPRDILAGATAFVKGPIYLQHVALQVLEPTSKESISAQFEGHLALTLRLRFPFFRVAEVLESIRQTTPISDSTRLIRIGMMMSMGEIKSIMAHTDNKAVSTSESESFTNDDQAVVSPRPLGNVSDKESESLLRSAVHDCSKLANVSISQITAPFFPIYSMKSMKSGRLGSTTSMMSLFIDPNNADLRLKNVSAIELDCIAKLLLTSTAMFSLGRTHLRAGNILGKFS
jgi:hypothetical protein